MNFHLISTFTLMQTFVLLPWNFQMKYEELSEHSEFGIQVLGQILQKVI